MHDLAPVAVDDAVYELVAAFGYVYRREAVLHPFQEADSVPQLVSELGLRREEVNDLLDFLKALDALVNYLVAYGVVYELLDALLRAAFSAFAFFSAFRLDFVGGRVAGGPVGIVVAAREAGGVGGDVATQVGAVVAGAHGDEAVAFVGDAQATYVAEVGGHGFAGAEG